jgi:undecaprenyl pyrophosphate phosphatase UppP
MHVLFAIVFILHLAYHFHKRSKRRSEWSWPRFFILTTAIVVVVPGFMLPVLASKTLQAHPGVMVSVMFGGMLIVFGAIVYLYRKYPVKASQKNATQSSAVRGSAGAV